jgi:hypothetical protein
VKSSGFVHQFLRFSLCRIMGESKIGRNKVFRGIDGIDEKF